MFEIEEKRKKKVTTVKYEELFMKGVKVSFFIFFLSIVFLFFWIVGHSKEHLLVHASTPFTKAFFFLNPVIFKELYFKGNFLKYVANSVSRDSLFLIFSHAGAFFSFIGITVCCFWLFYISYKSCVRNFHYISCLGLFPVIGVFLIFPYIFFTIVFLVEKKRYGKSRYEKKFEREEFGDPWLEGREHLLTSREKTTPFNFFHYEKFFGKRNSSFLDSFYKKISFLLS